MNNIMAKRWSVIFVIVLLLWAPPLAAHHFKGLPHFNYFENYPQIPQDEFLGQMGDYECSLVIYDFQGIDKGEALMPDKVCFYLVVFNLRMNNIYNGAVNIEILNNDRQIYSEFMEAAVEENIYTMQENLTGTGRYSLRVILNDAERTKIMVPFVLSSQKIPWGKYIGLIMIICVVMVIVGSRRARVKMDRKQVQGEQAKQAKQASGVRNG